MNSVSEQRRKETARPSPDERSVCERLHCTLSHHGFGNLLFCSRFVDLLEDVLHDALETSVDFLEGPAQSQAVLAHFQCGHCNTAGIGSLGRSKEHAGLLEGCGGFEGGRHIGAFCNGLDTVGNQGVGGININFILRCAGECDIAGDGPDAAAAIGHGYSRWSRSWQPPCRPSR